MKSTCVALHDLGQSVWLDNINDGLLQSGDLKALVDAGTVYGVTSNPTIFKNAIASGTYSYPAEIVRLASAGKSAEEIFDELSARDIVRTADLLAETYRKGTGRDGFVSLEVPPALAHDTEGTIAEVVYLGMYTQLHIDTRAGRIVSHRLADELAARLEPGERVTLSWAPEHASVLAA